MNDQPLGSRLENVHRGSGGVWVHDLLHPRSLEPFSAALWCELEPGAKVGRHRQQRDPELIICVSGQGEIEVDKVSAPFTRGVTTLLPHGSTLALCNPGTEPLVYLIIKAHCGVHRNQAG